MGLNRAAWPQFGCWSRWRAAAAVPRALPSGLAVVFPGDGDPIRLNSPWRAVRQRRAVPLARAMRIPTAAMASSANTGPHERGPVRPPRVLPANEPAKLQHAGTYRQIRYHPADAPGTDKGRGRWATRAARGTKRRVSSSRRRNTRTTPSANRTTPRDRSRTRRSSRGRAERRVRARLRRGARSAVRVSLRHAAKRDASRGRASSRFSSAAPGSLLRQAHLSRTFAPFWGAELRSHGDVIVVHLAERGVPGNAPFPSFDLNNVRSAIPTGGIVCGLLVLAAAWSEGSSSSPSDGRRPRSI